MDEGFNGQNLWSKRTGGGPLCEEMSVAKACLFFLKAQHSIKCKQNPVSVKEALPRSVEDHIREILSLESNVTADNGVCLPAWLFLAVMEEVQARRKEDV